MGTAEDKGIDLLVFLIISGSQVEQLRHRLVQKNFIFTQIDSKGGLIQEAILCLLIGLNSTRLEALVELVNECCQSYQQYIPIQVNIPPMSTPLSMIEAKVGGATIYTLKVERFEQI